MVFSSPRCARCAARAAAMVPTAESSETPSDALRVVGASDAVVAATTSMAPTHAAMTPYFILRDVAPVSRVSRSTSGVDSSADEARVGIASGEVSYYDTTAGGVGKCDDRDSMRSQSDDAPRETSTRARPRGRGVSRSVRGPGRGADPGQTLRTRCRANVCVSWSRGV